MKIRKILTVVVLSAFLLGIAGCAGEADRELGDIFGEIHVSTAGVTVAGLRFGMTQDEALKAMGLTENDVQIREIADINATVVQVLEPYHYAELAPYGTQKSFSFVEDKLTNIGYNTLYHDIPAWDGYVSALAVVNEIKKMLDVDSKKLQYADYGSVDALREPGGFYTLQWVFANEQLTLNMNNQDMSEAEYTELDEMFSMSVNIRQR